MKSPLVKYFSKQLYLFKQKSRRTHQNPNRKNVHDLRVTIRRIRASLWLIENSSPRISFGKLPTSLRKLGQILGEQRELDVAIQDANYYHIKTNRLKTRRRSTKTKLLAKIDLKHRKKILRELDRAFKKLQSLSDLDLTVGLTKMHTRLLPWVRKAQIKNEELHKLRVTAKKARYVLEAIGRPVHLLRELQDPLGRGHDLEVLQKISGKNKKVQSDAVLQYKQAKKAIQPALRFAIRQLKEKS